MKYDISKYIKEGSDYLVVGSLALGTRYSKDIDIICYYKDIAINFDRNRSKDWCISIERDGIRIEFLIADFDESLQTLLVDYKAKELALNEVLYILKAGHIHITDHRQENWEKHIHDLHCLKVGINEERLNFLEPYIKLHRKTTNQRINQKTPSLKGVKKDDFFDDFVVKYIEHDDIHKIMAHKEMPMYEYMKKDDTVECHKDLWNEFTFQDKLHTVMEEAYVIAIERRFIPALINKERSRSAIIDFKWALYRICTTLCSGWFRQFAIDNYYTILNEFNPKFFEKFTSSELFKELNEKQPI